VTAIDLHSHVLPGLDDGPPDMDGSLALARAAVGAGTRVMAATPHVGQRYAVVPGELPDRVAALREALHAAGIPLDVVTGGELAASVAANLSVPELEAIALDGGSCVLLECPFARTGRLMPALVAHLQELGFRVLLAHPERSPECLREPELTAALVEGGAYVQVTAASLDGQFGRTVRRYALALLDAGLVHVVASDAHDADARGPDLVDPVARAIRHAGLPPGTARLLTEDAPRALLDDAPIPRAGARARRRRRAWAWRR
jgi:protein-tyrosine phosphatase